MSSRIQRGAVHLVAGVLLALASGCQLFVDVDGLEDMHCGPDEKACPQGCVKINDPNTGCGLPQCAPCAPPHARAGCGDGQCILLLDGCVDPWKDCNGKYEDGCEVDIAHSPLNCGGCGNKCAKPDYGIAGCSDKACTIGGCNPGREDCDGKVSTGCEQEIWTDQDCMGCGLPCPAGTSCNEGVCE